MALPPRLVAPVVAENPPDPLAVLILGPTGSGKTALSLALAREFQGEIVSCDSVAVYRGMDLGSAKPSLAERAEIPHHLIDVTTPDHPFTAGDYSRQARAALHKIAQCRHLPIVTGGTGLYLRALTLGLFAGPPRQQATRDRLTRSLQRQSPNWLHRILARLDPPSARRIHPNDTPKLIRALEIRLATRRSLSATLDTAAARDPLTGFRLLRIGLNPPRQQLYDRINQRAAAMFASGLSEETRTLLAQYGRVKALDALGYRQSLAAIDGNFTEPEAIAQAQQGHRNYAKRQLTWFRREPEVRWIENFGDQPDALHFAADCIRQTLLPA
jgi:tRNA dimethylallyltransferase